MALTAHAILILLVVSATGEQSTRIEYVERDNLIQTNLGACNALGEQRVFESLEGLDETGNEIVTFRCIDVPAAKSF